jgi:hypothetical protein
MKNKILKTYSKNKITFGSKAGRSRKILTSLPLKHNTAINRITPLPPFKSSFSRQLPHLRGKGLGALSDVNYLGRLATSVAG